MKKILGIEIPADLGALSSADLKALGKSIVAAIKRDAAGDVGPEKLNELNEARTFAQGLKTTLAERAEADAGAETERAAVLADADDLDAAFDEDADADGDAAEGDGEGGEDADADAGDGSDADGDADAGDADKGDAADGDTVTAGAKRTPYRPTAKAIGNASDSGSDKAPPAPPVDLGTFAAAPGLTGIEAGENFETLTQLAGQMAERWEDIKGGTPGKKGARVATLQLPKGAFHELTDNQAANIEMLTKLGPVQPESLTAAICAPREQRYESVGAVVSSVARPVKGSLNNLKPMRGGYSQYPTPKLADVDGGYGIWTRADDADDEALKECGVIPCASSDNYDIYAIYRCLTVKNMMALTFPELVAAFLNRLQALQARMAEIALLDAMLASVNTKNVLATGDGQGAAINLFSSIANAAAIYREEERLGDQAFDAWVPRWVFPALQIDVMRQRKTSGRFGDRLPGKAEIESSFRDVGLGVTWTMDVASSWAPVPVIDDGDTLPSLPSDIDVFFTPAGNMKALDRGNQELGVTNNILRDNEGNSRNEFTMWWESYEGILDEGAVSYALHLEDVCFNGVQVADVAAIDCLTGS